MESCGDGRELPLSPLKRCVLLSVIKYFPLLPWNVCFDPRVISELVFYGECAGWGPASGMLWCSPGAFAAGQVFGEQGVPSIFRAHGQCGCACFQSAASLLQ